MKKIFNITLATLAVSAVALGGLTMSAGKSAVTAVATAEEEETNLIPLTASVTLSLDLDLENKEMANMLTIVLPTQGRDNMWNYSDLTKIDKVEVYRVVGYYDTILLETFESVTPGETIIFKESEGLEAGVTYNYRVRAYNGDEYSEAYVYGDPYGLVLASPSTSDFILTPAADEKSIEISIVCPAEQMKKGYYSYEPLPAGVHFSALKVYTRDEDDNEVEVKTFENPVPEQTYTFTDNNIKQGNNRYYARVECDFGVSEEIYNTVFVGKDFPDRVKSLNAVAKDGGVLVSWAAPDAYNGGRFDVSEVVYTVYRKENSGEWHMLAENLTETSYFDDLKDLKAESSLYYRVVPSNGVDPDGTNIAADTYSPIMAGPPAALPFVETFNSWGSWERTFDNKMETSFNYNSFSSYMITWDQSTTLDDGNRVEVYCGVGGPEVDAEHYDADNFYMVKGSFYGTGLDKGYMKSGNLSFADATDPVFSFYYIPLAGSTGTVTLEMWADDGEGGAEVFEPVQTISFDPTSEDGGISLLAEEMPDWTRANISLKDYAGQGKVKFRLAFQYTSLENRHPMFVDHLTIGNYPSLGNLKAETAGDAVSLSWDAPAGVDAGSVKYEVYVNDDFSAPVATVEEPAYVYANAENGEYIFSVKTVYADGGEAANMESVLAVVSGGVVSGVEGIAAEGVEAVEYYDLTGARVAAPAKGAVVIELVKYTDGRTTTTKTMK